MVVPPVASSSCLERRGDDGTFCFFDLNPEATEPEGAEEGAERFWPRTGVDGGAGETSTVDATAEYSFRPFANEQAAFRIAQDTHFPENKYSAF